MLRRLIKRYNALAGDIPPGGVNDYLAKLYSENKFSDITQTETNPLGPGSYLIRKIDAAKNGTIYEVWLNSVMIGSLSFRSPKKSYKILLPNSEVRENDDLTMLILDKKGEKVKKGVVINEIEGERLYKGFKIKRRNTVRFYRSGSGGPYRFFMSDIPRMELSHAHSEVQEESDAEILPEADISPTGKKGNGKGVYIEPVNIGVEACAFI